MSTTALAIQKLLAALPAAANRDARRRDHERAEAFHAAVADVLIADDELSEPNDDLVDRPYWKERRRAALGKAGDAADKMPALWLAILGIEVKAAPAISAAPSAAAE